MDSLAEKPIGLGITEGDKAIAEIDQFVEAIHVETPHGALQVTALREYIELLEAQCELADIHSQVAFAYGQTVEEAIPEDANKAMIEHKKRVESYASYMQSVHSADNSPETLEAKIQRLKKEIELSRRASMMERRKPSTVSPYVEASRLIERTTNIMIDEDRELKISNPYERALGLLNDLYIPLEERFLASMDSERNHKSSKPASTDTV